MWKGGESWILRYYLWIGKVLFFFSPHQDKINSSLLVVISILYNYICFINVCFFFLLSQFLPKFTVFETKSFIANYLCSAKPSNIQDASFFLIDCVMNALMRIIVYMKIASQTGDQCSWDYVENTIVNFFDAVNVCIISIVIIYSWMWFDTNCKS